MTKTKDKISVTNPKELSALLTQFAGEINNLKDDNKELKNTLYQADRKYANLKTVVKDGWAGGGSSVNLKSAGEFVRSLCAVSHQGIIDNGGKTRSPDWVKAAIGTPLVSDSTTGSYLVPTEFHDEIIKAVGEKSVMLPLVRQIPMTARQKQIPVKNAAATLTWITGGQGTTLTETSPTFSQKTLTAYPVAGYIALTESMLADDATGIAEYFRDEFSDDLANDLDEKILSGSSTPWDGILNVSGTNSLAMGAGNTSFSDVTYDDILNLISEITTRKYRRGATFVAHPTVVDALRKEKDANGRYVYTEPQQGHPGLLAGYPIRECDAAPSTTGADTAFLVFGNFRYFALGVRKELSVELYDKVLDTVQYEQVYIRGYARYAGVTMIPAAFAILKTAAS